MILSEAIIRMIYRRRIINNEKKAHLGPVDFGALYGRAAPLAKCVRVGLAVFVLAMALVSAGCASAPATAPPAGVEKMAPAELLYQAALSVYETREIPVEVASERFLIITSEFQLVEPTLRKRMVTRVVRAAPGAMGLTVTAEWQTRVEKGDEFVWQTVDTPILRERGNVEELAIARATEKRFNAWKKAAK